MRILALDLGEKRIGVAVSDETRTLARSWVVIKRSSRLADFEKIKQIVDELAVTLVIVGLPLLPSGEEGNKAAWARDYATGLAEYTGCPVQLWDESYSTVDAAESLRARGIKGHQQRQRIDAAAAAFILQSFLDAQRSDQSDSINQEADHDHADAI